MVDHGIMPVIENDQIIGTGYLMRDVDFPGDDLLIVNDDYGVPVDVDAVRPVINFSNPNRPNEYWLIQPWAKQF